MREADEREEETDWADGEDSEYDGRAFFPTDAILLVTARGRQIQKRGLRRCTEALRGCLRVISRKASFRHYRSKAGDVSAYKMY